jgi:S1-C subfamily serine protease
MRTWTAWILLAALAAPAAAQEIRAEDPLGAMESTLQSALSKAAGSVVGIWVDREPEAPKPAPKAEPRMRMPGAPLEEVFAKRPHGAWCSGVVAEASGIVLTTHFNVSGRVKAIKVRLADGRELDGKLLGYNGTADLAAIKVEAEGLPVPAKAPLDRIRAGMPVVALGRAPDGRGLTANPGIVSASARLVGGKGVQTDAKLNFGNVGGPLVDLDGRLVGITCKVDVKYASSRGQNSGVGFAVTHDRVGELLASLKEGRNEAEPRRPFLGIEFNQKSKVAEGVELQSVTAGGAAERAGLKPGDVIVAFDGRKVSYFDDLRASILRKAPGDRVKVRFLRGSEEHEADCELGWAPGE